MRSTDTSHPKYTVERVQTGVRMEKRLLKVLRAFADYHDLTLGDLLGGIAWWSAKWAIRAKSRVERNEQAIHPHRDSPLGIGTGGTCGGTALRPLSGSGCPFCAHWLAPLDSASAGVDGGHRSASVP